MSIKKAVNERDMNILKYITESTEKNGYAPSVRDIQNEFQMKSTSTVHACLVRLEEAGYIAKVKTKSRAIRVKNEENEETEDKIPLVGRVAAGLPIFAEENIEGYVRFHINPRESKYNKYFALRVKGTSMTDVGILDGDVIIVRKTDYAENGTIVVAGVDDEATVKRFYKENGRYRLQPENKTMKPIIVDDVYIMGIVVASMRFYDDNFCDF